MFPQKHIDGFEKYWRRRKPGTSTYTLLPDARLVTLGYRYPIRGINYRDEVFNCNDPPMFTFDGDQHHL